jgi:hypothetical protein
MKWKTLNFTNITIPLFWGKLNPDFHSNSNCGGFVGARLVERAFSVQIASTSTCLAPALVGKFRIAGTSGLVVWINHLKQKTSGFGFHSEVSVKSGLSSSVN